MKATLNVCEVIRMGLLKPIENGRMYPGWWRWNPIGGCLHSCTYCSIKRIEARSTQDMTTPVFRNGENGTKNYLKDNLGSGRKIFVCSSGDMWGEWVESEWIKAVLDHCQKYPDNEYMFLTKDPVRYRSWGTVLQYLNCIIGTTVETDKAMVTASVSDVPVSGLDRLYWLGAVKQGIKTMISIEPVMKFSHIFADNIKDTSPYIVYIGVDSGKNGLPEPSPDELQGLIDELRTFTDVRLKSGIERILEKPGRSPAVKGEEIEII